MAETGGFEPPVRFNPDPSLAVKSIRPLWHVSSRLHAKTILTHKRCAVTGRHNSAQGATKLARSPA